MPAEGNGSASRRRFSGSILVLAIIVMIISALVAYGLASGNGYLCAGAVFWGILALALYLIRPSSVSMKEPLNSKPCIFIKNTEDRVWEAFL